MAITTSILKSYIQDLNNCQHLHAKFDAKSADWRPQANMRTTLELMQYLTYIGKTTARHFINPSEDHEEARTSYRADAKQAADSVTFENFPEMIEREKEEIRALFSGITDADLARMTYHPFSNEETTLFEALLTVGKYLCAYRHQLFLYAKMCGAEINTRNNWYGIDAQPAPVQKAVAEAVA
jgi:hypothetical protein